MDHKDEKKYMPNQLSLQARLANFIVSILFIVGGGYGIWMNDLVIAIGRKRVDTRQVYHLHDEAAIIMYIGLFLVGICFISEIVDHYDKRNNEHIYHKIATFTLYPGMALCVIGFLMVVNTH